MPSERPTVQSMIEFHDLADVSAEQTIAWLEDICADLRPGDWDEMKATNPTLKMGDPDPLHLLTVSVMQSVDGWIITDSGKAICVFGAADGGIVWMIGANGMERPRAKLAIGRATPNFVDRWHLFWPHLSNYIDARNHQSIHWLLWAGFEIEQVDLTHGRERRPFYLMSHTREGPTHL